MTTTSSTRPRCTSPRRSSSNTFLHTSIWCWRPGPTLRGRSVASVHAVSCSRSAAQTCASRSTKPSAYLNGVMDLSLTEAEVEALEVRTEGWVAALQLAALSLQRRHDAAGFITDFAGDDRFIVDYLADEVLDRQTAEIRRFLLHTSILGRLTGPLCDAVTGETTGKAMLEALERANLFLVPLDDRRDLVPLPPPVRRRPRPSVSSTRSRDSSPCCTGGRVTGTSATASELRRSRHALAAEDFARAAELIELAAPAMRQTPTGGDAAGVVRRAPGRGLHEPPRADRREGRGTDGERQVRRRRGAARQVER